MRIAADDLDALEDPIQRLRVVDQVEIAVAQAELDLLHAALLVGVRQQRLAQEVQLVGEDGQLAGARRTELAINA